MSTKQEWLQTQLLNDTNENTHKPLEEEYSFYQAVKRGDLVYVKDNVQSGSFTNQKGMGTLSKNPLTNIKYHFVVATAMLTRHCVEGGLELEQAYGLSDFYIQKMDQLNSIQEVGNLHKEMVLDFTEKMSQLQKNAILSKSIVLCTDYIYSHINERITVATLAEYTNLSESYLSRLFKQNLGISVSDYIREKKIEKAKNLLKYSEISLIEISNYLSFSSESHFIQLFEKKTGITPKKYRDQYYHKNW